MRLPVEQGVMSSKSTSPTRHIRNAIEKGGARIVSVSRSPEQPGEPPACDRKVIHSDPDLDEPSDHGVDQAPNAAPNGRWGLRLGPAGTIIPRQVRDRDA